MITTTGLPAAPNNWEFSYHGYTFHPDYTTINDIDVKPVADKTGRTVSYTEFTIKARTYLLGLPEDQTVQTAVRLLGKYGGKLVFRGRTSFGNFDINTSLVKDIDFGPKPGPCNVRFLGPTKGTELSWSVVVRIPNCSQAVYQFAAMELAFTVEHRLRENGRVDRSVSGELRIPNNRRGELSHRIFDSPDEYRSQVAAPVSKWFRREWAPWRVNEARTVLTFGWTDYEFDRAIYPPGVVMAKASQTAESNNKGLVSFTSTLSASYKMAAGYDAISAEKAFAMLLKDRLDRARKIQGSKITVVPVSYRITDPDLYGDLECQFSMTYMVIGATIRNIVQASGIWQPIASAGAEPWSVWQASVQNSALNPYGYSKIKFRAESDGIVDLCQRETSARSLDGSSLGGLKGAIPAWPYPETSWLYYDNQIRIEADSGLSTYRRIGTAAPTTPANPFSGELTSGGLNPFDVQLKAGNQAAAGVLKLLGGATIPPATQSKPDEFSRVATPGKKEDRGHQYRASSSCWVFMTGVAMRVGFAVPCPELLDVEGKKPRLDNRHDRGEGFACSVVSNAAAPVYGARWNLRYYLEEIPAKPITPPPNPMLQNVR